nr:SGNH hydrolase-type esterase domain-containing protein [Tanacetum cinerariifolium]
MTRWPYLDINVFILVVQVFPLVLPELLLVVLFFLLVDNFLLAMPLLPAMLLQAQAGGGGEVAEQAVPHPMPAPDQSPAHLPTPYRPQTSDLLLQSLSMTTDLTHMRLLLALSQLGKMYLWEAISIPLPQVTTLMQKVHSLEAELHDHKRLFKDVVGKLVKKVKTLEVKLKTKKRKLVVSDSDQEDGNTQDMDLDALRAFANAAVAVDSDIPSGSTSQIPAANPCAHPVVPLGASDVPATTSVVPSSPFVVHAAASAVPAGSPNVPAAVTSSGAPVGVSSKGKSPMVEEHIPIKARTFRQMEEDRLGEEVAKRFHDEEMAQMERERAKAQRKRQQEVLNSAMYYNESDWLNTFLKVVVTEDSDDEDCDDEVWSTVVGWEILMHKLEIDSDFVGNDLTTVEQLVQFIKNKLVAAYASSV